MKCSSREREREYPPAPVSVDGSFVLGVLGQIATSVLIGRGEHLLM